MKPFLLIAGFSYYPSGGSGEWRGCYETYDEARKWVTERTMDESYRFNVYDKNTNTIDACDWFEIVDLREWIYK